MEDDNAADIVKWLFKDETKVDLSDELYLRHSDQPVKCLVKLKGNLLAIRALETAVEPILIVCENIKVEKNEEDSVKFLIKYGKYHQLELTAKDEKSKEEWMLKISMASHNIARGELDEVSHQYLNISSKPDTSSSKPDNASLYFLTSPFAKKLDFFVKSTATVPARKITCTEEMYESKLSIILPFEYIKLANKWAVELVNVVKSKSWRTGSQIVTDAAANVVRHLNSNIEIYQQAIEFLENYDGPSFRKSKDKFSIVMGPVPTNLHVQIFKVVDKDAKLSCHYVTSGATAAIPLRFKNGGLHRQKESLLASLDDHAIDNTDNVLFSQRRHALLKSKKIIGTLTRKIDNEWQIGEFGHKDLTGAEILAEIKRLYETITSMTSSIANINNLFNVIYNNELLNEESRISLATQMDALEMSVISLDSKMEVINTIDDNVEGRDHFQKSAKTALNSTLDIMLHVVEGLINAQILGLVNALRNPEHCQTYFHAVFRKDFVLSQIITVVATSLLTSLDRLPQAEILRWDSVPPLVCYFSFLSCFGDEKGMMEDMFDMWTSFCSQVRFKFIPSGSSVSQICIPQIEGIDGSLTVSLPLIPSLMNKLGPKLAIGEPFYVQTSFWNLGINHEATMAQSMTSIKLEEQINFAGCEAVVSYVKDLEESFPNDNTLPMQQIHDQLFDLQEVVEECPSRKNVAIFTKVMTLMSTIHSTCILACKSGKDRTSMAVTLEEARFIKEHCCIFGDQLTQVLDNIRRNGVRLENCRKNIGKSVYSFSPFQLHFLPKDFCPPSGTYSHNVAS
uniref:PH domain-containing protein n=2 Tax=Panagrolaimus sp. PS1159 TaxID=55785 RepID=A0AC35FF36_9BILA